MSGYCPDCGNTLCICDEVTKATYPLRMKILELEARLKIQGENLHHYTTLQIKLEEKYDKATTQLVSYEATIGYLKEALEDIARRGTGTGGAAFVSTSTLRDIARSCLGGLKK